MIAPSGRHWISPLETSAYLGFCLQHTYSLIYAKKIPAVKIGRAWRVDKNRLDAMLEKQIGKNI